VTLPDEARKTRYETRDELPPQLRAISDTLDEWLMREHGTISSWQQPDCFLEWLEERGWTVLEKAHVETLERAIVAAKLAIANWRADADFKHTAWALLEAARPGRPEDFQESG